ncbi:hypothetical protein [Avibacterium avium]|uniref:Uncharacterized protein n=1 Tax=Avibacterium avium TaxID=751 RepID=A0A379AQQ5_AVIAV|nr:hypothetical protein [Avibacterium avium]SUB23939.1 Uncharacterised protein [Avibacterium avium]
MTTLTKDDFLPEQPIWEDGVYMLKETDPVLGGPTGVDNLPLKHLANRTLFLKGEMEKVGEQNKNAFRELAKADGFRFIGQAESIEQLRTIRPTEHGQRILVKSYYVGGTTGGGEFVADLQDLITPDDGGTCFVVPDNGGRWKRIKHTSLFDYGIIGDGQINDTSAFNRLEQYSKLIYVDLQGKSYQVDKTPRNKIYFNGTFLCNDQSLSLGQANMLDNDILVTVGDGGDFGTINQAITYLVDNFSHKKHKVGDSTHSSRYAPDALSATIKLLSGFTMREQVIIRQSQLGWINLVSEDQEVVINRASLIKSAYFEGTSSEMFPAFYAGDNAEQLLIACKFRMDNTGDGTNRHGYVCNRNSRGHIWSNCGINNAGGYGCFAREGSSISCRITYFENAGKSGYAAASASSVNAQGGRCSGSFDGASAFGASTLNFERGEANNCRNDAVVSLSSSNVGCDYAELNNAGRYGIRAQDGGSVGGYQPNIKNSANTAINCISGYVSTTRANLSGTKIGVSADRGGKVNIPQSTIICLSRGVHGKNGSQIDASDSTIRGSEFSVNANFGSSICVTNSDCRADGVSEASKDLQASNGSFISAKNAQGGTNTPINQFGENGAIFK